MFKFTFVVKKNIKYEQINLKSMTILCVLRTT